MLWPGQDRFMPARHVLLAVAVAVVWGVNFVVIHVGLADFPPLLFVALRFTLVAFPAVLFVRRPAVPWRSVVAVGVFLSAGQFGLLFVAMDQGLPAGLASLVLQVQVLFTIGLAVLLLGERPRRLQVVGALIALGGIAVIALGRGGSVPLGALLLSIGAAASWGVGNICTRRAQADDPVALLVWSSLIPPLPLAGLSLALGEGAPSIGVGGVLAVLYVVGGATFFGFGSWVWLMRHHPASRVVPFALLVPVAGIASAWIALGERPNTAEMVGAGVVLAGLAVATSVVTSSDGRSTLPRWLPPFRSRPSVSLQASSPR
jgi:O-acetylserine/cysteine efflux transporter